MLTQRLSVIGVLIFAPLLGGMSMAGATEAGVDLNTSSVTLAEELFHPDITNSRLATGDCQADGQPPCENRPLSVTLTLQDSFVQFHSGNIIFRLLDGLFFGGNISLNDLESSTESLSFNILPVSDTTSISRRYQAGEDYFEFGDTVEVTFEGEMQEVQTATEVIYAITNSRNTPPTAPDSEWVPDVPDPPGTDETETNRDVARVWFDAAPALTEVTDVLWESRRLVALVDTGGAVRMPRVLRDESDNILQRSIFSAPEITAFDSQSGLSGSSWVGFTVGNLDQTVAPGATITLNFPYGVLFSNPGNINHGDEFRVQVEFQPTPGSSSFPRGGENGVLVDGENGHTITSNVLIRVESKFNLLLEAPDPSMLARIMLPEQTSFVEGTAVALSNIGGERREGVHLATARLMDADPGGNRIQGATGTEALDIYPSDTANTVTFSTEGNFLDASASVVFLDLNGNLGVDDGESLTIAADAMSASIEVEGPWTRQFGVPMYFIPDGTTEIQSGSYTTSISQEYDAQLRDETSPPDVITSILRSGIAETNIEFALDATPIWMLATEIFGDQPADAAFGNRNPQTITLSATRGGVTLGGVAEFEYRLLGGASFGPRALAVENLEFTRGAGNTSATQRTLISGGQPGDTSVTFLVAAGEASGSHQLGIASGDRLTLTIPSLQGLGSRQAGDEISVQVAIFPTRTTGEFNFQELEPLEDGELGSVIENDVLVRVGDRFSLSAAGVTRDDGTVFIPSPKVSTSNFSEFATGAVQISLADGGMRQAIILGTLGMTEHAGFYGQDGLNPLELLPEDELRITLSGPFHDGATAFIDLDGRGDLDEAETISLADGLVLSGTSLELDDLIMADRRVYLVTDGSSELNIGTYMTTMTLDFINAGYIDRSAMTPPVTVAFNNISARGFAYAIPNCTQVERGSINITNETVGALAIFMQGMSQDGADLGLVELDASLVRGGGERQVQPGETLQLLTEHIEQLFSLNDGSFSRGSRCDLADDTWQGRAQLTFLTSGNITVLPQIQGSLGEFRDIGGFSGLKVGGRPVSTKKE